MFLMHVILHGTFSEWYIIKCVTPNLVFTLVKHLRKNIIGKTRSGEGWGMIEQCLCLRYTPNPSGG